MANYKFSADLLADVLFRAGEPTDGTSDWAAKALEYLNRAYQSLCDGGSELDPSVREDWWWLRKQPPGTITLLKEIVAGTVTVTNNSTSITFTVGPTPSVVGYFFRIDGDSDIFRIATHTAASTSATLDSVYTGTTGAGKAYKLIPLEYDLASDYLRVISPMRGSRSSYHSLWDRKVHGIDLDVMETEWPLYLVQAGPPDRFAFVTESKVRFNRYADANTGLIRLDYDYLFRPTDLTNSGSEEPVVPLNRRKVIADLALAFVLTDKDDTRAAAAAEVARRGLLAMSLDQRHRHGMISEQAGRLTIRGNNSSIRRGPLRTSSGLIVG